MFSWEAVPDFSQTVAYIVYYKYKADGKEEKIDNIKTTSYLLQNIQSMVSLPHV